MGYQTSLTTAGSMPRLTATDPANPLRTATFDIAWPCAGIESLLIFTVVALLFLKRMPIPLKAKIGYFAIGAAVTYLINILRIVAIFNWNERRRRANVPFLLRPLILDRVDCSVSPDNPFKPEPMAQNHQQRNRKTAFSRSEGNSHLTQNSHAQPSEASTSSAKPCLIKILAFSRGTDATSSTRKGP